ncbi:ABC transporter [Streptomyces sp. NPDC059224]|uniref:ABC transporter n=1 Tax=Streptomyces sp. NPDC059224 TaxID=3346775 RepID=UPI00369C5D96
MSNLTTPPAAGPGRSASSPAPSAASRRIRASRLSGMTWLTWRQHRAAYWTYLAVTALITAWIAHQRAGLMDHLTALGWPDSSPDKWTVGIEPYVQRTLKVGLALLPLPVILGVFLGAPLLAGDLESGTAKLVMSQSPRPSRWLTAKLGLTVLVVVVCTTVLSLACGRWWTPLMEQDGSMGWDVTVFSNTGPVPVALTVFSVVGGVAIGMVLRRTLFSMVATFFFTVAVELFWSMNRLNLANPVRIANHSGVNGSLPPVPPGGLTVDSGSYITSSGKALPMHTCLHEPSAKAVDICLQKKDVVGKSVDYLPLSQLSSTQWLDTLFLFALAGVVTAFIFLWGRKRIV